MAYLNVWRSVDNPVDGLHPGVSRETTSFFSQYTTICTADWALYAWWNRECFGASCQVCSGYLFRQTAQVMHHQEPAILTIPGDIRCHISWHLWSNRLLISNVKICPPSAFHTHYASFGAGSEVQFGASACTLRLLWSPGRISRRDGRSVLKRIVDSVSVLSLTLVDHCMTGGTVPYNSRLVKVRGWGSD